VFYEVVDKRVLALLDETSEILSALSEQARIDFGDRKPRRKAK
jgi:hypothetical protein